MGIMKRTLKLLFTVVLSLTTTVSQMIPIFAMETSEFDEGMSKGINYFNKGMYAEARDEFQWFCDANWSKLNDGQKKYALDYLGQSKRNYYINAILGWWINYENMCSTQYYFKSDGTMQVYFDSRPVHWDGYYTVNDNRIDYTYTVVERTNTIISGHIKYQDGQLKDYNEEGEYSGNLIKTQNYMTADDIATKFVYNNENVAFDDIKDELSEIAECFHNGLYIETVDKCNYILDNYILNNDDRKYVLFYRDSAQACYDAYVKTDNNSRNGLSTNEFDNGMRKGIDYFNKGLYYEARDEFQWFCDYNWGKMNAAQQKYALDYLGGTNAKLNEEITLYMVSNGYLESIDVPKVDMSSYLNKGWSTVKPQPKYETTDAIIKDKALTYYKSILKRPTSLELYSINLVNMESDWDYENGIVRRWVYIDGSALNGFGGYTRSTSIVIVTFNRYGNNYNTWLHE